jgi:hypothetical protein
MVGTATVTIVATGGTAPYSYTFFSTTNTTGVLNVSAGTGLSYGFLLVEKLWTNASKEQLM